MAANGRILSDIQQKELDQVKKGIRSLLIAEANAEITPQRLNELYEEFFGIDIPIQNFYFSSLVEFLASISDACELKTNKKNVLNVRFVENAKTKHISDMKKFEKVKNNRKKQSVSRKVNPTKISLEEKHLTSPETNDSEAAVPLKIISKERYTTCLRYTSDSSDLKHLSDSQSIADLEKTTSSYKSCHHFTNPVMKKFVAGLKQKRQNKKNSSESTISDDSFYGNANPEDIIIETAY